MSLTRINVDAVLDANSRLSCSRRRIERVRSGTRNLRSQLGDQPLAQLAVVSQIGQLDRSLDQLDHRLKAIVAVAEAGALNYRALERRLGGQDVPEMFSKVGAALLADFGDRWQRLVHDLSRPKDEFGLGVALLGIRSGKSALSILGYELTASRRKISETLYAAKFDDGYGDALTFLKRKSELEVKDTSSYEFMDANKAANKKLEQWGQREKEKENLVYDPKSKQWVKSDQGLTNAKKVATIMQVSATASTTVSLLEAECKGENYETSIKVGTAEAMAEVAGGFYVVDKNGNKTFSPGVSAKAGVSVSAIEASAKGDIGSDMLGAYGEVEAKALAASAEASVGLGLVNGELEAKVSAEAEAVLVELEGEAGFKVLGSEIGVSGSVKVGVGASVDVGYADGKIRCEIGASLGIGVEFGIEADVSGLVDMVDDVSKAISDVTDDLAGAMDAVADRAVDAAVDVATDLVTGWLSSWW